MENQQREVMEISEECRSECVCASDCESLHSYRSEDEDIQEDKEIDKFLNFEEKKIIYELYRDGKFDYNQLKEMLDMC